MVAELPKLFDRDFAIGYFLPLAVFVPCMHFVASSFTSPTVAYLLNNVDLLKDARGPFEATVFVITLWLGAILLLVMNYSILRFKEGYGKWNPLRVLKWKETAKFRRLHDEIHSLEEQSKTLRAMGLELDENSGSRLDQLNLESATRFPNAENLVLATAFGNAIRAWEVYPLEMYGIDAIPGWDRLVYLIPEKVRPLIDQDKAYVDFWLNVWFLSLLILGEYGVLAALTRERGSLWALMSIPIAMVASAQARSAAVGWGKSVKAAFDVYLPDLRDKLELRADLTRKKERKQWTRMSAAIIYRDPDTLPPRVIKTVDSGHTKGDTPTTGDGSGGTPHE
jgi:hypothetical protein